MKRKLNINFVQDFSILRVKQKDFSFVLEPLEDLIFHISCILTLEITKIEWLYNIETQSKFML